MENWRYDPSVSPRDLRLDFLRGFCLLKMVFDHMASTPIHEYKYWVGYVTAAEGFFLISGAVVGIVYGRRALEDGLGTASRMVVTRAFNLYLANLALVFLFISLELAGLLSSQYFSHLWSDGFDWPRIFNFEQPYYLRILPRYVAFLALTPLALWCLRTQRTTWLLMVSGSFYALNLVMSGRATVPFLERSSGGVFPIVSWQVLFFYGMALGYHRDRVGRWFHNLNWRKLAWALAVLSLGFVLLRGVVRPELSFQNRGVLDLYFSRSQLSPLRLLNLTVVFGLAFLITDRLWKPLNRVLGPLLIPFGQHSLFLFLMHIPVVVLCKQVFSAPLATLPLGPWILIAIEMSLIAFLWWMIRKRILFNFVPR